MNRLAVRLGLVALVQLGLVGGHQVYEVSLDVPHPHLRQRGHLGILLGLLVP